MVVCASYTQTGTNPKILEWPGPTTSRVKQSIIQQNLWFQRVKNEKIRQSIIQQNLWFQRVKKNEKIRQTHVRTAQQ
jgi:hypothetical protein